MAGSEAEKGLERCLPVAASVVPEHELVEMGLELGATDAVMGPEEPLFEVAHRPARERHSTLHLVVC